MRSRLAGLLVLAVVAAAAAPAHALAGPSATVLAQVTGPEEEAEGQETGDTGGAEKETEPGGDEGEGAGSVEKGPVWTYQMARLALAALLLMFLAIGAAYYRFVVVRQRGGA